MGWSESNPGDEQVIARLLVVQRVANQSELENSSIVSGTPRFKHKARSMGGSGTLPGNRRIISMDTYRRTSEEKIGRGIEVTFDMRNDKV